MSTATEVQKLEDALDALLASHENGRDLDSFAKYAGKPVEFMRTELDFHPFAKQIEVIEAFETDRQVAVRGAHGMGKDAVLAPLMLYAAYVRGMLVLAISATERQLLGQLWKEVGNRFSERLPGELYSQDLRIGGKKRIVTMTSGNTSSLTGWHDPNGVFVAISEAQGENVGEVAFDAAIANAVDDKSRIVVVGNSIQNTGRFFEVSRKPTWRAIRISAFDHPNISGIGDPIPGGPSKDWPQRIADEYGIDSPFYIGRVLAEFPDSSVDGLVRRSWLDRSFARWSTQAVMAATQNLRPQIIADIARAGPDMTCVGEIRGCRLSALELWHEPDLMETARKLDERAKLLGFPAIGLARPTMEHVEKSAVTIVLDDAGVGGGCVDRARQLRAHVVPFNGGWKATRTERFANTRAEAYWTLREALQTDWIALPPDEQLAEELLATEFFENTAGKIQLIAKDDIKVRIGRSPDRADVAAMAAWRVRGPRNTYSVQAVNL